jgi:hypothetical protein
MGKDLHLLQVHDGTCVWFVVLGVMCVWCLWQLLPRPCRVPRYGLRAAASCCLNTAKTAYGLLGLGSQFMKCRGYPCKKSQSCHQFESMLRIMLYCVQGVSSSNGSCQRSKHPAFEICYVLLQLQKC